MLKKLTSTTIITLSLTTVAIFGQSSHSQNSSQGAVAIKTLTGVVSDSMCGAKHMAKNKTPAECTRECVKAGSDYALVVGKNLFVLKGNQADIDKLAGKRATVKGSVNGNIVTVESIAAAKQGTENLSGQRRGHDA
jgi:hypothetical protein